MKRKEAIAQLEQILLRRRDALRRSVEGELTMLQTSEDGVGDSVDAALDASHDEMCSQLAETESRELTNIENALARLRDGEYGNCEGCSEKIPLTRLKALPYATLCVNCQRDEERVSGVRGVAGRRMMTDWLDDDPFGEEGASAENSQVESNK